MTIRKRRSGYGKQSTPKKAAVPKFPAIKAPKAGKGIKPITTPIWDLYRDGITQSMIGRFLYCRERFRLGSVEGLSQLSPKDALEFGTAFHHCIEHVARGGNVGTIRAVLNKFIATKKGMIPQEQAEFGFLMRMVEVTFQEYHTKWSKMDAGLNFVLQEDLFDFPFDVPGYRSIRLRGRIDAAYLKSKELWLMENKTKGRIDEDMLRDTLNADMQTMFYCMALRQKYGKQPDGVLYNVIRRSGCRRKVGESDNDFIERIRSEIRKQPDHYFMRWQTQLMPGDLDTWIKITLTPVLVHICRWWESIKHDPFNPWTTEGEKGIPKVNVEHFQRPFGVYDDGDSSGGRGDFFELLTKKNYWGLYRRPMPFPELVELPK